MASKEVDVRIEMEEGDVLGATPSENLVITRIQKNTLADGVLQEGDKILKVNSVEPKDSGHFYRLLNAGARQNQVVLRVRRDKQTQEVLSSLVEVPMERLGTVRIRDGFRYKLLEMEYRRGEKLGLGIKDYMNFVLVTKCPDGTASGRIFHVGDQICDVDTVRVTDKGVAQNLIMGALKASGRVSMLVAMPVSEEAKKWVAEALQNKPTDQPHPSPAPPTAPSQAITRTTHCFVPTANTVITCRDPPSIRMKGDVKRVAAQEIHRIRSQPAPAPQSILRGGSGPPGSKRVSFNGNLIQEHKIVNENPNVPLRPVK